MKRKIRLLIGFSVLALVVLTAIQCYLVRTAYDYEKARFREEIQAKIGAVTRDYSAVDSSFYYEKDQAYKALAEDYILNKSLRRLTRERLLQNPFKTALSRKLQQELQHELPNLELDFAVVLNKFVLYHGSHAPDTLFAEKPRMRNLLYGKIASLDDAFLIRNYVGTVSGSIQASQQDSSYKLLTEDSLYITVANWQWIILRRMTLILAVALGSILTLVLLFVLALRALISQKRVSDVKTDFINNITHELKTPLTTLAVSTKMLRKPELLQDPTRTQTVLETMERQNLRLQQLIDQVMANALGHEALALQKEAIVIDRWLGGLVSDFSVAHPELQIQTQLEAGVSVTVDKFHFTTAVLNVLENAVKYGSSHILIQTSVQNGRLHLGILDNGIGIAKDQQLLLFDKFYRVTEGNLHSTKGLGLGLYYVDQILKAHRGSISVASALGKGAQFNLSIPLTP